MKSYDKIILGAGLYGLYAAMHCGQRDQSVLVLEYDNGPFERATYINQARVHQGYHYPRSLHTALKSAHYFRRFTNNYSFCINKSFKQIYATSAEMSWSNAVQFAEFCQAAHIPCERVDPSKYFTKGLVDGAFVTEEFTFDAQILKDFFVDSINRTPSVQIRYGTRLDRIERANTCYELTLNNGETLSTPFLLNASYASVNQVLELASMDTFDIKYELCEIALCDVNSNLRDVGITVMDGPFFSIMPFGETGFHSLTSVSFTPHQTSASLLPRFKCQEKVPDAQCSPLQLGNCNNCPAQPLSAYGRMSQLARKYLSDEYKFDHVRSLYSMKPILRTSEIDDSRPTVIKKHTLFPTFCSVLSGKINTVFDLDEVLDGD